MFTILFTNHLGSVIRILNSNLGVLFFFLMKKPTNFGIVFLSRAPGYAEGKKNISVHGRMTNWQPIRIGSDRTFGCHRGYEILPGARRASSDLFPSPKKKNLILSVRDTFCLRSSELQMTRVPDRWSHGGGRSRFALGSAPTPIICLPWLLRRLGNQPRALHETARTPAGRAFPRRSHLASER